MNLRETFECWPDGEPDHLSGREDWQYMSALVTGWAVPRGVLTATTTNGRTMRIHNLDADTRSAPIRRGLSTARDVIVAVFAQLDAMPFWEEESDTWGPDPWMYDDSPDVSRLPIDEGGPRG